MIRLVLCAIAIIALIGGPAGAEEWVVFGISPDEADGYSSITFDFSNNVLSLNTFSIGTAGGSSNESWTLLFSGVWAAMGTVDTANDLTPDPYATFIYDGTGGHVHWAADTPEGYTAQLLLGYSFNGDGAPTYSSYYYGDYVPIAGTLVLRDRVFSAPDLDQFANTSHTFYATVPEPSSLLALVCGLVGMGGLVRRRQKK
jgi:hypothetical protein